MKNKRLNQRKLRIWRQDYLVYKYLWPNIEWAVNEARIELKKKDLHVIDIGCGHKPYADLFEGSNYIGTDYSDEDSSPDIIADATNIPISSDTVDIVFSTQVIEHVPNPQAMIDECYRLICKDGFLILTGPFYWPLHEEPYDFHRFSKYGFENLLKNAGFSTWQIKPDGGDWAQIFLSVNLKLKNKWTFPLRIIFNLLGTYMNNLDKIALSPSNYTVLARK